MKEWRPVVTVSIWLAALLWILPTRPTPFVFFVVFWPLWVLPLGWSFNWSLTALAMRRFRAGLADAGVPSAMDLEWGYWFMRGARFQTPRGPVRVEVKMWFVRRMRVWLPTAPTPVTFWMTGWKPMGRDVAARLRAPVGRPA